LAEPKTTLLAAFEDRQRAMDAVQELERQGFDREHVGFVIRGEDVARGGMITDTVGAKDARGAALGAVTGGVVGGILAAAISLLVPGIGPVLAGGLLTMAAGGAIAGTAVGGILGALQGLEVSEEEARFYDQEFRAGRAIVAVRPGTRAQDAMSILARFGGRHFESRQDAPIDTRGLFSEP
jgi:hypothetical protein